MRATAHRGTGMMAQELNVQVISNNIANMRTTGYNASARNSRICCTSTSAASARKLDAGNILPVGIDLGAASRQSARRALMNTRHDLATGGDFTVAVRGEGFFKVLMPDGTFSYTARRLVPARPAGPHRHAGKPTSSSPASPFRPTRNRSPSARSRQVSRRSRGRPHRAFSVSWC